MTAEPTRTVAAEPPLHRVLALARRHALVGGVLVLAVVHAAYLVHLSSDLWFVADDWDFLLTRGTLPGVSEGWWAPHNDHWSTAIVAIYRTMFPIFGMRSYLAYAVLTIGIHLSVCVLVVLVVRRAGAARGVTAVVAVLVIFLGAGSEAYLWDAAMNLSGSVLFGLTAVAVVQRAGPSSASGRPLVVVWAAGVVSLMFSATGITMVGMLAVFAALELGWRAALKIASVPTVAYLLWFVLYGRSAAPGLDDPAEYWEMPSYIWTGLVDGVEKASGIPGSGAPLLLAIALGAMLFREVSPRMRHLAVAGLCAAAFQLTVTAYGRVDFGIEFATSSRYAYAVVVFLAPAVALCLGGLGTRVREPRWVATALACWLLAMYVGNAIQLEREYHDGHRAYTEPWKQRILGISAATDAGEKVLTDKPDEWFNGHFRASLITRRELLGRLPSGTASAEDRLDAERLFFVAVSTQAQPAGGGGILRPVLGFDDETPLTRGCRVLEATGDVAAVAMTTGDQGAQFGVQGPSTKIETQLVRDGIRSANRAWPVSSGRGYWVATTAQDAELVVDLGGPGSYTVCLS